MEALAIDLSSPVTKYSRKNPVSSLRKRIILGFIGNNDAIDFFAVAIVLFFGFSDDKYLEKPGFSFLPVIPTYLNFS